MEHLDIPADHKLQLQAGLWEKVANGTLPTAAAGDEEEDTANSYVLPPPPPESDETRPPYYYAKLATSGGSYSCLVMNLTYDALWVGHADAQKVQRMTRENPLLLIGPEDVCRLLRGAVGGGGGADLSSATAAFRGKAAEEGSGALVFTVACELRLAGQAGASVPLAWQTDLTPVHPHHVPSLLSHLVVSPLVGVCCGLSYSHALFLSSIMQKDRELMQYRNLYGPLAGTDRPVAAVNSPPASRMSVALNPETYFRELLCSPAVAGKLRSATLSPLGDPGSHPLPHHNLAPPLYELYMRKTAAGVQTPPVPAQRSVSPGKRDRTPGLDGDEEDDDGVFGDAKRVCREMDVPASQQQPLQKKPSYVETDAEMTRRAQLTQKLTQTPRAKDSKAMRKKLKNVFR